MGACSCFLASFILNFWEIADSDNDIDDTTAAVVAIPPAKMGTSFCGFLRLLK